MSILRRIDGERFSEVLPAWKGETVAIVGGGPSLTLGDVLMVRDAQGSSGVRCIAVNAAYLWADFADVCYFADSHFWKWHVEGIDIPALRLSACDVRELFAAFAGQKCSIQNSGANITDDRVHIVRNKTHPNLAFGLSLDPRALMTGFNSGFQALNLAVLAGAARILLLGFDGSARDGRSHWHGGHPRVTPDAAYPLYRQAMSRAEGEIERLGVSIINCSPTSEINSWPKMSLGEALELTAA